MEAGKWLGELHLGRDLSGQTIDLRAHGTTLNFQGVFRAMIIDAAKRKLMRRGAANVILPE